MLKITLLSVFLVLSFSLSGCHPQRQENLLKEKPAASDPYLWDFGQVKAGEVLKHDFIFKNESDKTLTIKDVKTSCGCTVSEVKQKTLLPNETTLIVVQFDSEGFSGAVQQYVYVHTDSPRNPILKFTIKAEVVKE